MDDFLAALRAALDEEERIARATFLSDGDDGDWMTTTNDDGEVNGVLGRCIHIGMIGGNGDLDEPAQAIHIVRQSPKRTLRRAACDRKILDIHSGLHSCGFSDYDDADPCGTLLALAEAYGIEVEA